MFFLDTIEKQRLNLQEKLDSEKTLLERNKLGQFATPPSLSSEIVETTKKYLRPHEQLSILEPAFGTGSFYTALLSTIPVSQIAKVVGYEIDPNYGENAKKLWSSTSLQLFIDDFTKVIPKNEYNFILSNPPYVRHHYLLPEEKVRLQTLVLEKLKIKTSQLMGLYCYFILLSHEWLVDDGLSCWMIPNEFMDVNYGVAIKQYLVQQVELLRVHRFNPNHLQFDDALVSSAVIWYRKRKPQIDHSVDFSFGNSLLNPESITSCPIAFLNASEKWSLLSSSAQKQRQKIVNNIKLSDLFDIKRGIVTGANNFFILSQDEIEQYNLPMEFFTPILPSPRYIQENEIIGDTRGFPQLDKQLFVFSCNLLEENIQAHYPMVWKYLQQGKNDGVHERYICKNRSPWYLQEHRTPSPIICTYMGRYSDSNSRPLRFILNNSNAIAPNVYLMMYPKPDIQLEIRKQPHLLRKIWEKLNIIDMETILEEGRIYGGGLHKIEPKELGNIPMDIVLEFLPEWKKNPHTQLSLF